MYERLEGSLRVIFPWRRIFSQREAVSQGRPLEQEPVLEPPPLQETLIAAEETTNNPTEIFNFLLSQVLAGREPIELSVFKTDPDMYRRVGQYEKALASLLQESETIQMADEIRKRQMSSALLAELHQKKLVDFNQRKATLLSQETEVARQQQQWETRIIKIGQDKVRPGDWRLMLGRVQVKLWDLQRRQRPLTFWAARFEGIFGARQVHPQIVPYRQQLDLLTAEENSLEADRQQTFNEYARQKAGQVELLEAEHERLFDHLDQWSVGDFDRFLVYLLYYPQRRSSLLEQYRKAHQLTRDNWFEFLRQLRSYQLLPPEFDPVLQRPTSMVEAPALADSSYPEASPQTIIHPLLFHKGDREIWASSEQEIRGVLQELLGEPHSIGERRFESFVRDLCHLASSTDPLLLRDVKKLAGGERVRSRVGGEYRYRNKGRRIIFTRTPTHLDIGKVGMRDERTYGRGF